MELYMNTSESLYEQQYEEREQLIKADLLNRVIARTIDFMIVVVLYEIIPGIGFFAGLTYLLIADGLFQGRSAGKRLIGLKVIIRDVSAFPPACGFRESIFRNFPFAAGYILFGIFKGIPVLGWLISSIIIIAILLFECLVMLGNDEGMRMGDELAKTQVVQDREGGVNV